MIGRFRSGETDVDGEPGGPGDLGMHLGDVMRGERASRGKSLLDVQRELKIKATYIAAIENADPSVFETPGFIAGYVRSYSRYLDLDPEWAWRAFCAESAFETAHGMSQAASVRRAEPRERTGHDLFDGGVGFAPGGEGFLSRIEPGAVASITVLLALIGVIGYGGYAVLNEVQKVQLVPVEQVPEVAAVIDPLGTARPASAATAEEPGMATARAEALDRLYRPQALDVPVLVARDGPISTLDPRRIGALVPARSVEPVISDAAMFGVQANAEPLIAGYGLPLPASALGGPALSGAAEGPAPVQVVEETTPEVALIAVRPSWVRVRAADGTTIYERIMKEGDRFVLPATEEPAILRTGESGAIYFSVDGTPYGPAGRPGQVTGNLALDPESLTSAYEVADIEADTALARVVAEVQVAAPALPGRTARSE